MNKRIVAVAKRLALAKAGSFALNPSIQSICEEVGVGQIIGKKVILSTQDLIAIEKFFSKKLQQPILKTDLKKEHRLDAAQAGYDEKWAITAVFADLLNFSSQGDLLPLNDNEVTIPKKCVLSTSLKELDLAKFKRLIVIENGEILQHLDILDEILPDDFKGSLVIYRGHGSNLKALTTLISKLNSGVKIAFFCDYDAAGLVIAQSLSRYFHGKDYILVPKDRSETLKLLSKSQCYIDQFHLLQSLLNNENTLDKLKTLALDLNKFELAIMQEHMLANKIALQAYEI